MSQAVRAPRRRLLRKLDDRRSDVLGFDYKGRDDMEEEDLDIELPVLPRIDPGPPPDCPFCGDPMSMIDGYWGCQDCNGEDMGPETG